MYRHNCDATHQGTKIVTAGSAENDKRFISNTWWTITPVKINYWELLVRQRT